MKKSVFAIVAMVAFMACGNQVQAQNKLGLDDFEYQVTKFENSHYTDHVVYSVGSDPHEYTAGSLAKHGAYIGLVGGVKNFDGHTVPYGGGVIGWEGGRRMPVKFEYNAVFSQGHYTDEADRKNDYVEFDSHLIAAVCVYTSQNKQWRFWLGGYGSYKLSFDYHETENTTVTVRETEEEIVTTTDKLLSNIEVKASSLGFGGYAEVGYTPYMSHFSYRLYGGFGRQQRFYDNGNRWHNEGFGGVKVVYNFNAAEMWDKGFLAKTGLSKKQAKKLSKSQASKTMQWY